MNNKIKINHVQNEPEEIAKWLAEYMSEDGLVYTNKGNCVSSPVGMDVGFVDIITRRISPHLAMSFFWFMGKRGESIFHQPQFIIDALPRD